MAPLCLLLLNEYGSYTKEAKQQHTLYFALVFMPSGHFGPLFWRKLPFCELQNTIVAFSISIWLLFGSTSHFYVYCILSCFNALSLQKTNYIPLLSFYYGTFCDGSIEFLIDLNKKRCITAINPQALTLYYTGLKKKKE